MNIWYAPHEICFNKDQMIFLIASLPMLRDGIYPPECKETGYSGGNGNQHSYRAPFETPCLLAAEVDTRLSCTSTDGLLLVAEITAELPLHYEAKLALRYCSGWRRRRMSYHEWMRQKRYREKVNETLLSR